MKIEKSEIAEKLAKLKTAIPSKSNIPSLQGVLVRNDLIIANNLEIGITAKLSVETETPFILIPKAIDMICNLPDGEIEIIPADGNVTILAGNIKNKFLSHDPKEFAEPKTQDKTKDNAKINAKKLHEMASSVLYAASNNEVKPTTSGVLFEATDGEMSVVSLDGYRAAWNKTKIDGKFMFNVPRASLEKMIHLGMTGDVEISYSDKSAVFTSESYTVYTRLLAGEFFDYKKAYPVRNNEIIVNKKAFQESIARILICDDKESKSPVVISFNDSNMKIQTKNVLVDYTEEIKVHGNLDKTLRIGFNALYIRDALKTYDSDNITMSFGTNIQPMLLSDGELRCLLLPIKLNDSEQGGAS